ncbi:trypsin-like peptidase domain-containing protein [Allocoleopsis sp.]|uniref:trypsin-like peptidase domain-containing protein n=1 Tax=Allocoleopsis sp. TaxID=3088169 RepID=UPI002FD3AB27
MSSNNVRLQNLRGFTVRIRRANETIGTGIVVSRDGKIVTCAHVVSEASGQTRVTKDVEVGVYFPQLSSGETKSRRAKVVAYFPHHDDDVVLLQVVGEPPPLAPEQIAVLGTAELSQGHEFRSYGYRELDNYASGYVEGKIMGSVESFPGKFLQADPVELRTRDIRPGMSGAAVLDVERNLVVGIIARRWNPGDSSVDDNIGWAVDACVLAFEPMNLLVQDAPLPLRPALQPKTDIDAASMEAVSHSSLALNSAPPPLAEWVGREELLKLIGEDWADPKRRVTGLIGFGGEGKSSLARRWLDDLLQERSQPQPKGIFWWSFYEKRSVDEFFEAALTYMGGGRIDPRQFSSVNAQAHLIAAMLSTGRYLFILDGLEVLQYQEGDQYGLLISADLREFLGYFAAPGHESFCLITSRAPVLDLIDYTTYTHRDVERLSPNDGRALLQKVGVNGSDAALERVVQDWDGHALTLSLLGSYLVDWYEGDVAHIRDIPAPSADEPLYERVRRVLRRYDEHLTEAERAFLILFSGFRKPVEEIAFAQVFRSQIDDNAINAPIVVLDDTEFETLLKRLVNYRILRRAPDAHYYTAHPLIRDYYYAYWTKDDCAWAQATHVELAKYYLFIHERNSSFISKVLHAYHAGGSDEAERIYDEFISESIDRAIFGDYEPLIPTLEDLAPLIEVVHHSCCAGLYDEAAGIERELIDQDNLRDRLLVHRLGAYETQLSLMLEFFPNGDISQEPQVSDPNEKRFILNEIGFCLVHLGRLAEAGSFYERGLSITIKMRDGCNSSIICSNLARLYAHLGALTKSENITRKSLEFAAHAENRTLEEKLVENSSLALLAWIFHLRGNLEEASAAFQQAEAFMQETAQSLFVYLYSVDGIQYAEHLRRLGKIAYAKHIAEASLRMCKDYPDELINSHRILGDLDADTGQHESACQHYDTALKIARSISHRSGLIEVLRSRGRWAARRSEIEAARSDLDEALGYAVASGYRVYEADIRVGLAWAHLAAGEASAARAEAERSQRMSTEMGYHWGQVDAAEVLSMLA